MGCYGNRTNNSAVEKMSELDGNDDSKDILNVGPGQLFAHYLASEELMDKVSLLNYEKEFVKDLKQKALSRHYFAIQTNPGEQFYLFVSLAAWLVRKCGKPFEQPQEYDDPNSTISSVLDRAREFGATVDFPPNRLKQGYGEHAVYVLNCLADHALKITGSNKWQRAEPKEEPPETAEELEDESELLLEKVEEEMAGMSDNDDDDDEDGVLNLDDLRNIQLHRTLLQHQRPEEVLQSNVKIEEWQVEIERVLPQLRVTVQADARDWRSHLEQMQKYRSNVEEHLTTTKAQLERVRVDIRTALEKIDSREKHLNAQLDPLLAQYRAKQEEFNKISEEYKGVNSGVTERSKLLSRLTEELEAIKKETEERSSSMTDGSPLINAKKAVARIKVEMKEMDVRLGVLDSEILQTRLRHKTLDHMEAADPIY